MCSGLRQPEMTTGTSTTTFDGLPAVLLSKPDSHNSSLLGTSPNLLARPPLITLTLAPESKTHSTVCPLMDTKPLKGELPFMLSRLYGYL
ncbi:hypothetical protein G6F43_014465 [Rhizopus delemar]|nr:hypothetical protein G6F43_014465 [Rhizopus delemar]